MIIFGTKGITRTTDTGDFNCPQCGSVRTYRLRSARRFFTLYFIPLIPLDRLGEFVECDGCRNTYRTEVLDFDPAANAEAFAAEYHTAVRRVMIHMMLADGEMDPGEVRTITETYHKLTGQTLMADAVRREAQELQGGTGAPLGELRHFAGRLNDHGKEMVISAMYMVAAADGDVADEELRLLQRAGQVLQMSTAHVTAVISEIGTDGAEPEPRH